MIRTKNKIYGEVVHPDTVTMTPLLPVFDNSALWVKGNNYKTITKLPLNTRRLLIADNNGDITELNLAGQTNKIIGTDEFSNIILIDRGDL